MTETQREEQLTAELTRKPVARKKGEHLATNEQIARWLAGGGGEVCISKDYPDRKTKVFTSFSYAIFETFDCPWGDVFIRRWGDYRWHEPTLEYMNGSREQKG